MMQPSLVFILSLLNVAYADVAIPAEETCTDAANVMLQHHADDAKRSGSKDGIGIKQKCKRLHITDVNPTTVPWCDPKYNDNPPPKKLQGLFYQNVLPEGETFMCWSMAPWNAEERTLTLDIMDIWLWNNCWRNFYIPIVSKFVRPQLVAYFEDDSLTKANIKLRMKGILGIFNPLISYVFNALLQFPMMEASSVPFFSASAGDLVHEYSTVNCAPGDCWDRPTTALGGNTSVYTYRPIRVFDGDMIMNKATQAELKLVSNHKYRQMALNAGWGPGQPTLLSRFAFWALGAYSNSECVNIVSPIHCVASFSEMAFGATKWFFGWSIWPWNWF